MPRKKHLTSYVNKYLKKELRIAQSYSKATIKNYTLTLTMFLTYMSDKMNCNPEDIRSSKVKYKSFKTFMLDMTQSKKWGPSTYNTRLSGIKNFTRFLSLEDPWFLKIYKRVKLIGVQRIPRKDPFYLKMDKINEVCASQKSKTWIALRDLTMVQMMASTAMRLDEVRKLKIKRVRWVSTQKAYIKFTGKGRKKRVVPLIDKVALENLKLLMKRSYNKSKYVFPSRSGAMMSSSNLEKRVTKFFSSSDIKKKVTPHDLRRSAAMNFLKIGLDKHNISIILGHNDVSTTELYLSHRLEDIEDSLIEKGMSDNGFIQFKATKNEIDYIESIMRKIRVQRTLHRS